MDLALAAALAPGGVRSVFQPIVDLDSGAVVAYEALARGPEGPLERPDALFAAARAAGRLAELDAACRTAAFRGAVGAALVAPLTVFVNVEPAVLDTAPLAELLAIAEQAPGQLRIVLEITERALAARPAELLRTVERVRSVGWGIAVDDVGAESLSLAFLPLLRPDVVKLDLRLVQERPGPAIAEIMNAVNAHAERTGALVLAEGIETEQHLVTARALGATLGQGWLFGRPAAGPVADRPVAALPLPAPAAEEPDGRSPFACLPPGVPLRRSPKALLIELSKQLEREAARLGETCVVAAAFQEARHFTVATGRRYRELVDRAGFVCALGADLPAEPLPGVRGAALDADDPVLGEWDVVVLGPHFAAALLARDLSDDGPDLERTFEYALTYDRDTVVRAAAALLSRVAPAVGGPRPTLPAPVPVRDPVLERALAAEQELRAERDRSRGYLARLEELVGTDPVTGLPGRQRIAEELETAVWSARAGDDGLALLVLDVDGVLTATGMWGHDAGDELLRAVADRLRGALRRKDLLARIGGHEFLVALRDLRPDVARAQALRIGSELLETVRRPVLLEGTDVPVGARLGLAVFPEDGPEADDLLRAASLNRHERTPG
ncbi:EAL domain-containing protein [Petropleomorpha daqingensis]|uniref:Diguanylate cyclase (GGDEF)-like protein n=1 Tax=Petropleomorpha daqingensis TaxID=2026353 RepID=A0A853CJ02_9ACTN|nr:diguanylate cyclase (GGDEF)-like protein [Petropleomorpha daqingensis]